MGATYGLGIVSSLELDTPRETVLAVLRKVAAFAGAPVRDVVDDDVVEVSPDGDVTQLDGSLAESITQALEENTGSNTYGAFEYLEGFEVLVPGEFEGAFLYELPGENQFDVNPLAELRDRLDELIASDEVKERSHGLHRTLREMCDVAEKLRVPLHIG
jgi:hypothetical protein